MKTLISSSLREYSPTSVTCSLVDHAHACDLVIQLNGCDKFGGTDPRLSNKDGATQVHTNPSRAIRIPCDVPLPALEDAILAYGWEAGAWDVVRYHTSAGYVQPGGGNLKAFGVPVYNTTVAGVAYPDQVGTGDKALANDAARYGFWKWVMKPSLGLGRLAEHRARRDKTMRADGSRAAWAGIEAWPQTKWLRTARAFDRSAGRHQGLQTVYILPPRRVEIYGLDLAETAEWQQPDEQHEVRE